MASEIKANKISPATGTAFTIGDSGDTFTLPSGATLAVASGATISNSGTASGFGGVNTPAFSAYQNTIVNLPLANTYYKAAFDTEELDTDGAFDTSTYRFTVPSGKAGKYFFTTSITVYNSASGWIADYIKIYKNGSGIKLGVAHSYKYSHQLTASVILDLVAGDYIEVFAASSLGSGTNNIQGGANYSCFAGFRMVE